MGKGGKGRGWKEGVREGESGMRGPQAGRYQGPRTGKDGPALTHEYL